MAEARDWEEGPGAVHLGVLTSDALDLSKWVEGMQGPVPSKVRDFMRKSEGLGQPLVWGQ